MGEFYVGNYSSVKMLKHAEKLEFIIAEEK